MSDTHPFGISASHRDSLSVVRFTLTAALTMALLFIACWVGVLIAPNLLSHMFIQLFTAAPMSSVDALWQGLCSSLFFGGLTGLLVAWLYNGFAFLDHK